MSRGSPRSPNWRGWGCSWHSHRCFHSGGHAPSWATDLPCQLSPQKGLTLRRRRPKDSLRAKFTLLLEPSTKGHGLWGSLREPGHLPLSHSCARRLRSPQAGRKLPSGSTAGCLPPTQTNPEVRTTVHRSDSFLTVPPAVTPFYVTGSHTSPLHLLGVTALSSRGRPSSMASLPFPGQGNQTDLSALALRERGSVAAAQLPCSPTPILAVTSGRGGRRRGSCWLMLALRLTLRASFLTERVQLELRTCRSGGLSGCVCGLDLA